MSSRRACRASAFSKRCCGQIQKCVLTGCECVEALEAAHIVPYADGTSTTGQENPKNGLLMRADVHKVFDANLLKVQLREGHLYWWVDVKAGYLDSFRGKCCDDIFNNVDRRNLLENSDRIMRHMEEADVKAHKM